MTKLLDKWEIRWHKLINEICGIVQVEGTTLISGEQHLIETKGKQFISSEIKRAREEVIKEMLEDMENDWGLSNYDAIRRYLVSKLEREDK